MKNKKIIISVAIAIILCIGIIVGTFIYFNLPNVAARNSIFGFVKDLSERDEIKPLINMSNGGSLKLEAGEGDAGLGGKIYFSGGQAYFESCYVSSDGERTDFDLFLGKSYSYLTLPDSFEKSIGFINGEAASSFEDSVFAYGSGTKYECTEELHRSILEFFKGYDKRKQMEKDLGDISYDYMAFFIQTVESYAKYEATNENIEVGYGYTDARVISVSFDTDALTKIIDEILNKAENDQKLRDFALEYGFYTESFIESLGVPLGATVEESFDNLIEALGIRCEDFLEDMDGKTLLLELATPKFSSKLLKLTVSAVREDKKHILFGIDAGESGIRDSNFIQVRVNNIVFGYEIQENSDGKYSSVIKARIATSRQYKDIIWCLIDKKANTFDISMNKFSVSGSCVIAKDKFSVDVYEIIQNGKSNTDFICRFELSQKDSMPRRINKNDLLKLSALSEQDAEKLIEILN